MPLFLPHIHGGTYTLWLVTLTPAVSQPSLAAGHERRRESEEDFCDLLLQWSNLDTCGERRRAAPKASPEENFAIFEAQVVDFEHSSGEPPGRR